MTDQIRTFIALELPPEVRQVLTNVVGALKAASAAPVRWVNPGNAHLTLKFLGNVDAATIPRLLRTVREAADGAGYLRLAIGGLGAFPNPSRARVVWLGLEGDLDALSDLQLRLVQATAALGLPGEGRPFTPHLTLGRMNNASPPQRRSLEDALARVAAAQEVGFEAKEVVVMRSDLWPGGAVYTPLGRAPF